MAIKLNGTPSKNASPARTADVSRPAHNSGVAKYRTDEDILEALLGSKNDFKPKQASSDMGKSGTPFPSFQTNGSTQSRSDWKGFKSSSTSGKPATSQPSKPVLAAPSRRDKSKAPEREHDRQPARPSNAFSGTTIRAVGMQKSPSFSSDDSVKKYGQFVPKPETQITYDYAVDYTIRDGRRIQDVTGRKPHKVQIRGAAERQAAQQGGEGRPADDDDRDEDEHSEYDFKARPAEPRGWGTYKRHASSEEEASPDGRDRPEKELRDEWDFDDIEEPAGPSRQSMSSAFPETEGRVLGGGEYGQIQYGESAPGWQAHITRKEDPNMSREEKSMLRFKESTAALESAARDSATYVPDHIPAKHYIPPDLKFSRDLSFPKPEPLHWVAEDEEAEGGRRPYREDRYRYRPRDPSKMAYYANPGGGYGRNNYSSDTEDLRDEAWIKPRRQQEEIAEMDIYRASWENQRRGVSGRFNDKNRRM